MDYRLERQQQHERRLQARGATFKPSEKPSTLTFVFHEEKGPESTQKPASAGHRTETMDGRTSTHPVTVKPDLASQTDTQDHDTSIYVLNITKKGSNSSAVAAARDQFVEYKQMAQDTESSDEIQSPLRRPRGPEKPSGSVLHKKHPTLVAAGNENNIMASLGPVKRKRQLTRPENAEGEWALPITTQSRRAVIQFGLPLRTSKHRKTTPGHSYGEQDKHT